MMKKSEDMKVPLGVFFYAGFASLFAYNMLLFEIPAFGKAAFGVNDKGEPDSATNYLTMVYGGACNLGLVVNLVYLGKALSMNARIASGAALAALTIGLFSAYAELLPATATFGVLMLVTVMVFSMASSTLQGALGAAISTCPGSAITAFSLGQAAAGVPTLPLNFLVKLVITSQTGRLFIELGLAAVLLVGIIPVFKFLGGEAFVKEQEMTRSVSTAESQPEKDEQKVSKVAVVKHIWPQVAVVWLSMFITFNCLPEHFLKWGRPQEGIVNFEYLIWCFQISDTIGRLCTFVVPMPSDAGIFVFTGLRVLLIPLCYFVTFDVMSHWFLCYAIAAVLAVSLALNLTWGLIRGPQRCERPAEKDVAGMVLTFALLNGIFVGSMLSRFVLKLSY